jgi:putative endonuclease
MQRGGAVYIMTNKTHTTLYTGVTSNLKKRIYDHRHKTISGSFTAKYQINKLVYYEGFHFIQEAIGREKQIKAGSRKKKVELINSINPEWKDLYNEVMSW